MTYLSKQNSSQNPREAREARLDSARQAKGQWKKECIFCKEKIEPDLKDSIRLRKFVTERGKIQARSRTGVCSKHQRFLTTALKQARQLALISYTNSL